MKKLYTFFIFLLIYSSLIAQTSGGPDQYGHVWVNSDDPTGPLYDWIDISLYPGVTTVSGLADDNVVGPFTMPIPFYYYGNYITQFWIGSNGYIAFQMISLSFPFPTIPSVVGGNNFIAPFMSDLNFQGVGNPGLVLYWSNYTEDTLIISFIDVPFWENSISGFSGSNTFQIILISSDNSITFQYETQTGFSSTTPDFISIGIENQFGTVGLQILHDSYPLTGKSYKISTPDYNLITGKLFIDINNNQIFDTSDQILKYRTVYEQSSSRLAVSNEFGDYQFLILDTGTFTIASAPITYYNVTPGFHTSTFTSLQQADSLNDFVYTPTVIFNDLQITLSPLSPLRPGFQSYYNLHYKNMGTTSLQGTVVFYLDSVLSYISSSIGPLSISNDSILWQTPLLNPFDEGDILVAVAVHASTPLGYWVDSWVKIEPVNGDANPSDNISSWRIETTGSYDPNDILVNLETILTTEIANPPYLEYLIRFQNTGTDTAFTVKVKNQLPVNTQINSFEFLESSHTVQLNYNHAEQVMWFHFNNILLPDSNTNEALSHGYIRYRIKPQTTLGAGDLIENSAAIYFDFNAPVHTNTAVTEIVLPISVPQIKKQFDFSIYPNPTTGELNISFTLRNPATVELQVYNNLGQIVKVFSRGQLKTGENKISFSTENFNRGIYYLKLKVNEEMLTKKIVKF